MKHSQGAYALVQ